MQEGDISFSLEKGVRRMTQQGAVLQSYNNELVKYLEDLSMHREELNKQIKQAEEERNEIQNAIQIRTKQLECVHESLTRKTAAQQELDQILAETEMAYEKILGSCRMLLNVLRMETWNLDNCNIKNNVTKDIQIFQQMQH